MKYIFTEHAKKRMKERAISRNLVIFAIANPDKILYDDNDRVLIKRLFKSKGVTRLLLVVVEVKKNFLNIITVIETSKLKKYL